MTRWLLIALAFVLTFAVTPKLHALYVGSLSLTDLAASSGGERRIVRVAGGETVEVVVHHNERWCECPGLGVVVQSRSESADSIVLLADALFRAFAAEAAREPVARRCLTVTVEPGIGRQDPLHRREQYGFSLWRRRSDQRWVLYRTPGDSSVQPEARLLLGVRWPQAPQINRIRPAVSPKRTSRVPL